METFFSQLPYLNFVILSIKQLAFIFSNLHTEELDLPWQPFYFNGLKDDNEVDIITKAALLVIGQILDAWFP